MAPAGARRGGPLRKLKSYEFRVLEYYENCIRDGENVRLVDIWKYCQQVPEFVLQAENTQKSWAQRFIKSYEPVLKQWIPVNGTSPQRPAKRAKTVTVSCNTEVVYEKESQEKEDELEREEEGFQEEVEENCRRIRGKSCRRMWRRQWRQYRLRKPAAL
ncbi:unnamed protein product [Phytophthora fragariaefolia]|uniref:Unnamed protein product n=1 Tax=Phytophthora fragariaefolia TaxID=1490495 RepID=A0A9W6YCJ3_9STRA|nr:unnamed protein product [Phytophthora fragariaefolia]